MHRVANSNNETDEEETLTRTRNPITVRRQRRKMALQPEKLGGVQENPQIKTIVRVKEGRKVSWLVGRCGSTAKRNQQNQLRGQVSRLPLTEHGHQQITAASTAPSKLDENGSHCTAGLS